MARETNPLVLLADDQADVREALRLLLKSEGIASVGVADPAAALEAVRKREFACALIDCNYSRDTTSGEEGLDLLERLRQLAPELPVVTMTAWGNVPLTVQAMRRGAADFIEMTRERAGLIRAMDARLADVDVMCWPTTPIVAPTMAEVATPDDFARKNAMALRNTVIVNFFDLCAISLPLPREGGLPTGLMLVARNGHDRRLFRIAAAVERLLAA